MRLQLTKEATAVDKADPNAVPIARAVDYLKKDIASGKVNGDAARALLMAGSKGYDLGPSFGAALAFLKQPAKWDKDQHLPLASALAAAERYGKADATEIADVAKLLAAEQAADGSWQANSSPGTIIATWSARSTLISSGMQPDNFTIVQADRWIRGLNPENVLEAAVTILSLELSSDVMAENLRRSSLGMLRADERNQPPVMDAAMIVLALAALAVEPRLARSAFTADELKVAVGRGKQYLVSQQRPDGGWGDPSTSGWALQALLAN